MTTVDLRVAEGDWLQLRKHFKSSFRSVSAPETGAIGLLGECRTSGKHEFLLAKVFWPESGDFKVADNGLLVFNSSYIRRAHLVMRQERLAGLVMFHTHPLADTKVCFSAYDDRNEPLLVENLIELDPTTRLVSVVAGKSSQCGRFWPRVRRVERLDRLIVVGESLSYLPLDGCPAPEPPSPAALFDRGLPLTSSGALNQLSKMKIAVVGASGTGSLLCELLARAGCKHVLVVDDDIVKDVNLNRILYATQTDVERRVPKVEVIRRGVEGLGLGCEVDPVVGNILSREVLSRLREADLVFGCVDRGYPRHLLSELSYQYLLPYIDVGSEIGADERGIVSLDARTSYVAPGRHCLNCTGVVTSRQLHFESLSFEERQRVIALGYSDDLLIEKPAVMDLNMRAASFGMMLLRHLLQPFLLTPVPVAISENLVTYTTVPVSKARAASPTCRTCQTNSRRGYGDCGPAIGLERDDVKRILGPGDTV